MAFPDGDCDNKGDWDAQGHSLRRNVPMDNLLRNKGLSKY